MGRSRRRERGGPERPPKPRRPRARGPRRPLVEELEARLLFSADVPGVPVEVVAPPADSEGDAVHAAPLDESAAETSEAAEHEVRHEIVFVDAGVEDHETLVQDLLERAGSDRRFEVVLLDSDRDGLDQIGEVLAGAGRTWDAVHVVSHGTDAAVGLGDSWLSSESLAARSDAVAAWGGALAADADLLFYGCDLAESAEGRALIDALARLTGADVAASIDDTGSAALGGDWHLEYEAGAVETAIAFSAAAQADFTGVLDGTLIWSDSGTSELETAEFTGSGFDTPDATAAAGGPYVTTDGAEAPTRDEKIVIGVNAANEIHAQVYSGGSWGHVGQLATVTAGYHGFDVAYESQSGDALIVYNDGTGITYDVWNGSSFAGSGPVPIPLVGEPQQMHLASNPLTDELVLVVKNAAKELYVHVWDGGSWDPGTLIPAGNSSVEITDISVVYEQQSGRPMILFGDSSTDAHYRVWNGSSWTGGSVSPPGSTSGEVRWTTSAADPNSNRIALAVNTQDADLWLAVWDGSSWEASAEATTAAPADFISAIDVAFESSSGNAIAAYTKFFNDRIWYQTWTPGGGWSGDTMGQSLGLVGGTTVTLDADPASDEVMLTTLDSSADVNTLLWDGGSWGSRVEHETGSGITLAQPFVFLWEAGAASEAAGLWLGADDGDEVVEEFTPTALENPTTAGTFSTLTDLDAFVVSGNPKFKAIHFVSESLPISGVGLNALSLDRGDLILALDQNNTDLSSTNALTVSQDDLFVFKPDTPGDYSSGTFSMLAPGLGASEKILAFTLVERDTDVGGVGTLARGSFLYVVDDSDGDRQILHYDPSDGSTTVVVDGTSGSGFSDATTKIDGIDLVEESTAIGGRILTSGQILVSTNKDDLDVGATPVTTDDEDVFLLDVTSPTNFEATLLFDGSDVAYGDDTSMLTLVATAASPDLIANRLTIAEGETVVLSKTNLSTIDADTPASDLVYTVSSVSNGQFEFVAAPTVAITSFTQDDVDTGKVQFVHDGSTSAPAYSLTVTDGTTPAGPSAASITFLPPSDAVIWFSSNNDVSSSGAPGLDSWSDSELVQFGAPSLALGPTTSGTLSAVGFDLSAFAGDGVADIDGVHYVSRPTTVGTTNPIELYAGDLLLSPVSTETLGGVPAPEDDLVIFRPDQPGDYGTGTFLPFLNGTGVTDLMGFALVEEAMTIGGIALSPGSLIFRSEPGDDVRYYVPDDPMAGTGTSGTLLDVSDIGVFDDSIRGIGLVQHDQSIGGVDVSRGDILLTVDGSETVGGQAAGDTDVIRLVVTTAGDSTVATGSLLLDGSDVQLDDDDEDLRAFTLAAVNAAPILTPGGPSLTPIDEDDLSNPGNLVSEILGTSVSDDDAGALEGLAITSLTPSNGTWEFSTDGGGSWSAIAPVSDASALLLRGTDRVRFVPDGIDADTASFDFRAWDQSAGAPGTRVDATTTGGETPFSDARDTADIDVSAVDDAPVMAANALTIAEGQTVVLATGDLSSTDVDTAAASLTYSVTSISGGQFEFVAAAGTPITSFTQDDVDTGKVQFVHDDGEASPTYSLTVTDGTTPSAPSPATITFLASDDPPAITTNSLTIAEGGTVVLAATDLKTTDVDTPATGLAYTVASVTGGQFELVAAPTVAITSFTQDDVDTSKVQFVHDGGEAAPTYSLTVTDGTTPSGASAATITFTNADDPPSVLINKLTISEGGSVVLANTDLDASDVDTAATGLSWTVVSVTGGQFELVAAPSVAITSFTQDDVDTGKIRFVHDGGEAAPTYSLTVRDATTPSAPSAANITFSTIDDPPAITTNALTISEGGVVVLSAAELSTSDPDTAAPSLVYTVVSTTHGQFEATAFPGVPTVSFTQNDVDTGKIQFVHDGGETAPTYSLTVSDGTTPSAPSAGTITFSNVDDAPVITTNALSITEGQSVVLGAGDLAATDPDSDPEDLVFTVTSVTGGQFELVAAPTVAITSFTQDDVDTGKVQFVHDGGEGAPSYSLTVTDGTTPSAPSPASITFSNVDDAPTIATNQLTIGEGGSVILSAANLSTTDPDTPATGLTYSVGPVVQGRFEFVAAPGVPITGFTQDEVDSGQVRFVHNGGGVAPSYSLTVTDGTTPVGPSAANVTFNPVDDPPSITTNTLTISEGETVVLATGDLATTDPDTAATGLTYSVTSVAGGQFELVAAPSVAITSFTQDDVDAGRVQFVHDGGEAAPTYSLTVTDGTTPSVPSAASITFSNVDDAPAVTTNALTISEGQTVVLSTTDLASSDVDTAPTGLTYSVVAVTGGQFELVAAPTVAITSFTQDDVDTGRVQFVHDGGEAAPTYSLSVTDGTTPSAPSAAAITFSNVDDAPSITTNALTITEGQTVVLSAADLSTSDVDTAATGLTYTVASVSNGQFELVAAPTLPVTSFTQDDVGAGRVQFVHDGGEAAPTYSLTVTDGTTPTGPSAATISFSNANDAPTVTGTATSQPVDDDATLKPFSTVLVGELDPLDTVTVDIWLDDAAKGTFATLGGFVPQPGNLWRFTGSAAAATTDLRNLDFIPTPNRLAPGASETVTLTIFVDDGTAAPVVNSTTTVVTTSINDAPTLAAASPSLPSISEDDLASPGATVASLLGGSVSDPDVSVGQGIAITSLASGNGRWQADTGSGWFDVGSVSAGSSLLLEDGDRVRFVPDAQNADSASFSFRAWDLSSGSAGSKVSTAANGGPSAFSTGSNTASITVDALNDAPTLADGILTDPGGGTLGAIFAGKLGDVDAGASLAGVAVVGNAASAATEGTWQYSSDGASWFDVGAVNDGSGALALDAGARVRFVAAAGFAGAPTDLVLRGLDDSYLGSWSSTTGGLESRVNVDTTGAGGVSAIAGGTSRLSTAIAAPFVPPPDPGPDPGDPAGETGGDDPGAEAEAGEESGGETGAEAPAPPPPASEAGDPVAAGDPPPAAAPAGAEPPAGLALAEEGTASRPETASSTLLPRPAQELLYRLLETGAPGFTSGTSLAELIFSDQRADFFSELDEMREEVEGPMQIEARVMGSAMAMTTGLSVGYVVWLTRGGLLLASLISALPAWRVIDPLPILGSLSSREDEGDESLADLIRQRSDDGDDRSTQPDSDDSTPSGE